MGASALENATIRRTAHLLIMRIAVLADIHGNLTALEAVARDVEQTAPDVIYHAGDLAASGPRQAEVVDFIRARGWQGVYGNTDEMLWAPEKLEEILAKNPARGELRKILFDEVAPFAADNLGSERIAWLRSLPLELRVSNVAILHAIPGDTWRSPLANDPDDKFTEAYQKLAAELVVYAHIHHPHVRVLPNFTVANTGSLSLAYDGDPRAKYLLITAGKPSHRFVEYDVETEAKLLRERQHPRAEWLIAMLRSGKYQPPF
jgi:predicted phosphodiesterase